MANTTNESLVVSHPLAFDESGEVINFATGERFNREDYSRMKYGDQQATREFGAILADDLMAEREELVTASDEPELLVAYKAVPPACYYLSKEVLRLINIERLNEGNEPGRLIQVYKGSVAATDYAAASQEARDKELQSIDFTLEGRSLAGKQAVILDDIRITGAAERRILEVIRPADPAHISLGYIALFDRDQAAVHPAVESELNSSVIKTAQDVGELMQSGQFDLNIRTLKLLLSTPESELQSVLEQAPLEVITAMYEGAINTGPDFINRYHAGFSTLQNFYQELGL